jgi:hypothetical protein
MFCKLERAHNTLLRQLSDPQSLVPTAAKWAVLLTPLTETLLRFQAFGNVAAMAAREDTDHPARLSMAAANTTRTAHHVASEIHGPQIGTSDKLIRARCSHTFFSSPSVFAPMLTGGLK